MHHFKVKRNTLYCEQVKVQDIADQVGAPCYIYSERTLLEGFQRLQHAFRAVKPLICFAMKANGNLAVCRALVRTGAGVDIVSGGELFKALHVGASAKRVVFAGVGKTASEIDAALRAGIKCFNVESRPELELINARAQRLGKRPRCALRVNPDVDAKTHRHISTGHAESKFGLDCDTAARLFGAAPLFPHVRLDGIHVHIGSQIVLAAPFVKALRRVRLLIQQVRKAGCPITLLNIGGGMGIVYKNERPQTPQEFAKAMLPVLRSLDVEVILEPGRFIAGNAGMLVTQVLYVKETPSKVFVIVDGGMNDLIRPALYNAYHEVIPATQNGRRRKVRVDVVGPICESGDVLAHDRLLPQPEPGEYLGVMSAGAYGYVMASNYNAFPRPAEVMVRGSRYRVVRRRETHRDLIRGERVNGPWIRPTGGGH